MLANFWFDKRKRLNEERERMIERRRRRRRNELKERDKSKVTGKDSVGE